ncbi:MAG: selenocysteine-specific translation elongation factor [Actinobacteria bacterium]|nr:selenocysteine-specific translation elongation factor [Actinomycetota bacterium]
MYVIGTAGHVDHGKSKLVEALTGIDPDRLEEEKRRGLTIDLGFAWLTLPSRREVGIVDVPGHERFIRNMLAGAGGTSVCLFVVAANEGWMPQSAEHLSTIDLLGIDSAVVVLTKSDTVDDATLEGVRAGVRTLLRGSSLAGAEIVACSSVTGAGIDDVVGALDRALDAAPAPHDEDRARLWVDRAFSITGSGTVVTGTLMGGALSVGDEVTVFDGHSEVSARVRALQSHKKDVERLGPGHRAAINLAGIARRRVERGNVVASPSRWVTTGRINAVVRVLDVSMSGHNYNLSAKGSHLMYVGTAETAVRVKLLGTDRVGPGEDAAVQISLSRPLPLKRGDRFVLRDTGRNITFGGGVVADPLPLEARRSDAGTAGSVRALATADDDDALRLLLATEGDLSMDDAYLRTGCRGVPAATVALGGRLFTAERAGALTDLALRETWSHHRDHPLERGMPKGELAKRLDLSAGVMDDLLSVHQGLIGDGPLVRVRSHAVEMTPEDERIRADVIARLDAARFAPPQASELGAGQALIRALQDSGDLVRIEDFCLTSGLVTQMQGLVTSAIVERGGLTVAQIRDLLGTTRRYALPLCGWLDQMGVTRRIGDVRVLGPKA